MSCPKLNEDGYVTSLDEYTPTPGLTPDTHLVTSISSSANHKIYTDTFQWSDARRHVNHPALTDGACGA